MVRVYTPSLQACSYRLSCRVRTTYQVGLWQLILRHHDPRGCHGAHELDLVDLRERRVGQHIAQHRALDRDQRVDRHALRMDRQHGERMEKADAVLARGRPVELLHAAFDDPVEEPAERLDVLEVEPGRRLVEDVDLGRARELDREPEPLALATREGVELLTEREVAEPDIGEPRQDRALSRCGYALGQAGDEPVNDREPAYAVGGEAAAPVAVGDDGDGHVLALGHLDAVGRVEALVERLAVAIGD